MSFKRAMRSLRLSQVKLTDPFWKRWQDQLVEVTLPAQFEQLVSTGRIANFERAAGKAEGAFEGLWFNDSDVYKFVEACAYALAVRDDPKVRECLERCTKAIEEAQELDGYINTCFKLKHPHLRWRNLNMMHEMYCGGHLIEAGVAVFENLGDRRLLDVSIRFADNVMSVFGPEKRLGYCGHEEIELALVRLSEATDDPKYREFARWMVEARGQRPSPFEPELTDPDARSMLSFTGSLLLKNGNYDGEYSQDHAPIRQHTQVVGHAVRAMYLYIAAADMADGQNDAALEEALTKSWNNLTQRRMYVTGGIGPSSSNEGFTADFDLPNLSAYAETCASIGLVFWGHKMLQMTGDGDYADVIERALYNGALSGISINGDQYFYANPLESRGAHERTPWFTCACCPPNIARLIGGLGHFVVGQTEDAFFIHTPVGFEATTVLGGVEVKIAVESDYPWTGKFSVRVSPKTPVRFSLYLRIPEWSNETEINFEGAEAPAEYELGYATFDRIWSEGDVMTLDLGMEPKWVESDPRVRDNLGRIALTNGPLVYALEDTDLGFPPQLFSADVNSPVDIKKEKVLGGINTLTVEGLAIAEVDSDVLYPDAGAATLIDCSAKLIPYFAWCNRGKCNMQVWLRQI